jgi:hypothetical protein
MEQVDWHRIPVLAATTRGAVLPCLGRIDAGLRPARG